MERLRPYRPATCSRMFFFAVLLMLPQNMRSQSSGIQVRAGEARMTARGGSVLAASMLVSNTTSAPVTIESQLKLPAGWKPVTRDPQFVLQPQQTDSRLISFSLPVKTPAGTYEVQYLLKSVSPSPVETSTSISVVVAPLRALNLAIQNAPRFVIAGNDYVLTLVLTNAGNMPGGVQLEVRSSEGFRVRIDSLKITLSPLEVREIPLMVSTPKSLPGKISTTTEVVAWFIQDPSVTTRVSSVVDVIPQVATARDQMIEIPMEVTGRISGEDDRLGGQIEVRGGGSLNEFNTHRVEFQMRTPDIQSQSSMGLRDEYRLRYTSPGAEVMAGDGSYGLSPLTELNRYGFGAGGRYTAGPVTAGGYYNETRFLPNPPRQLAGYVSVEMMEEYSLGVNYLKKQERELSQISSVRGLMKFHDLVETDLEYGISKSGAVEGRASAIAVSGKKEWLRYDLRHIDAGARYTGYYRNLKYSSLGVQLSPLPLFRLEGYVRLEERNRDRDTTLGIAPREQLYQIGVGYSNTASVNYRRSFYDDLFPNPLYRRTEDMVQLRFGGSVAGISLFSNVDFGSIADRLTNKAFPFQRYAIYSGFSPGSFQSYTASVEFTNELNLFTGDPLQRLSGSLGVSYSLTSATNAQVGLFLSRTRSPGIQDFGLIDAALQHVFPNQHRISLRARQSILAAPALREVAYVLQYGIPLSIPIARRSSAGQVRGRIIGEQGKGFANVLVNIGTAAAVTDEEGEFYFPSLRPGRHYLIIDKASMGLEFVTRQPMPMTLDVRGGDETFLTLDVTKSSTISAALDLYAFDERDTSGTTMAVAGPRSGMMIELTKDQEVLRRVTDNRGQVVFTDLRPGVWTIRPTGELPPFHFLEQEVFEIRAGAGKHQEVRFKILPRRRTVRILQEAEVPPAISAEPKDECLITYDPAEQAFVLQVSSWVTRTKALERARVAERVSRLKASIERATIPGKGIRYRVKVSPFKTREQAEASCKELTALEMQ
ncbi:MAG: SPOR domain-containing protein [Bacteroidota bacterium]